MEKQWSKPSRPIVYRVYNVQARLVGVTFAKYYTEGDYGVPPTFLGNETVYLKANERWVDRDATVFYKVLSITVRN